MGAHCKRRCLKLGKATRRMSPQRNRRSIIARRATARRGSANTPKRWRLRKPHDAWRRNDASVFVRRNSSAGAGGRVRTVSSTNHADWLCRKAGGKHKRAGGEGVRCAYRTNRLVVEPRPHVFARREEPFD